MDMQQINLVDTLKAANYDELHKANFGIVQFDSDGKILFYNQYEADLAGISCEEAEGKNFFTEIAPCTNNFMVAQKYVTASEGDADLDETLDYVFTYKLKPTKVTLRMLSQNDNHWLCVEKT